MALSESLTKLTFPRQHSGVSRFWPTFSLAVKQKYRRILVLLKDGVGGGFPSPGRRRTSSSWALPAALSCGLLQEHTSPGALWAEPRFPAPSLSRSLSGRGAGGGSVGEDGSSKHV